ncbi:MAG: antibiotic biosynthesis monooxygenase family protein [Candidatus Nanopelagicales bacterium]
MDDLVEPPVNALLAGREGLLVRLNCKPGMRPALLDALNRYADGLEEEPGTEMYVVALDPDDADIVWLFEIFKDEQAQVDHRSAPGFARMLEEMGTLLSQGPGVLRMNPLRMHLQRAVLDDDLSL